MERDNEVADFQEQNQQGENQNSTKHGLQMESNPPHENMEIRKVSAELFEEQIQELDRDIHKYDPLPELITKNIACTGKENDFESLTINEIFEMGRSQARGQPLYQPTRTPLSQIPDATNVPVINTATWKRQNRITTGTDVIMEDTVGSKRKNRDPALFSMVVWALWNRRNNLRLGKTCGTLGQLLSQANDRLKEFSLHNTVMTSTERRTPYLGDENENTDT
nr:hypothetical protein CFP56_65723 [Quercus suber]